MKQMNFRRITQMLMLILVMTFGMSTLAAHAAEEWKIPTSKPKKPFAGGSGTANDPYLISSAQELANLAYMVTEKDEYYEGKYFRQTSDIVLNDNLVKIDLFGNIEAGAGIKDAKQWKPIGDCGYFSDDLFMGIYDGDGHSISGIYYTDMSASNANYVGLFACTKNARISNLKIKNSYISPNNNDKSNTCIGALVGKTEKTSITNCQVVNTIVQNTITPYSWFDGSREASTHMGGLIGYSWLEKNDTEMLISGCSFDGYMAINTSSRKKSNIYIGGIVGKIDMKEDGTVKLNYMQISNCKSYGTIRGLETNCDGTKHEAFYAGIAGYCSLDIYLQVIESNNWMNFEIPKLQYKPEEGHNWLSGFINVGGEGRQKDKSIYRCANIGKMEYNGAENTKFGISGFCNSSCGNISMGVSDCVNYSQITLNATADNSGDIFGITNSRSPLWRIVNVINLTTKEDAKYGQFVPTCPHSDETLQVKYYTTKDGSEYNGKFIGNFQKPDELKASSIIDDLNQPRFSFQPKENNWGFYHTKDIRYSEYDGYPLPLACGGTLTSLSGKGTEEEPYLINDESDLRMFAKGINEGTYDNEKDVYYALNANIYMNNADTTELPTIGTSDCPFISTFDGKGYQIANLKKTSGALFGEMRGNVKNLALTHYSLTADANTDKASAIAMNVGQSSSTQFGYIENCYVTGNIDMRGCQSSTDAVSVGGICHTIYPGSYIKNCYFYGKIMTDEKNSQTTLGSICSSNKQATVYNCYGIVTNEDVQDKLITREGVTNCKDNAAAQQLSNSLGDEWVKGYYHPILKNAYHYECTDPDGNKVALDPIITIMPTDNDILCLEPSTKNMDDATMWKLPNVAVYTAYNTEDNTKDNTEEGTKSIATYMLANATLVDSKPLRFKPATGHENVPVKGLMNYRCQAETWQMLCLPGEVKLSDLPEGSKLYIGGTLNTSSDGSQQMNLVEVETIPAGVPFIAYIGPADTEGSTSYVDITMTGTFAMTPQTQEGSSLVGTYTEKSTQEANMCSSISNNGKVLTPVTKVAPFRAYVNSTQEVSLIDYLLLDEQSYDIEDIINDNATTDADAPKNVNIKMRRKLQTGGWNTLCLPFSLSEEEVKAYFGEDCKLEELYDVSSDANAESPSLTMRFKEATAIEAGKPYILKIAAEPVSDIYDFGNRTLSKIAQSIQMNGIKIGTDLSVNFSMIASYPMARLQSDENVSHFFIQQNSIYRANIDSPVIMGGFRCWLKAENMSSQTAQSLMSARMIHGDGSTTSLKLTTVGKQGSDARIFDLQGVEHDTMQRGINIVGGKKIVKK